MPLYTFRCKKCGHVFDKSMKINDNPPECEKCKEETEKTVARGGNFQLKGGGWYKDGY